MRTLQAGIGTRPGEAWPSVTVQCHWLSQTPTIDSAAAAAATSIGAHRLTRERAGAVAAELLEEDREDEIEGVTATDGTE